jgi:hypothetical protein
LCGLILGDRGNESQPTTPHHNTTHQMKASQHKIRVQSLAEEFEDADFYEFTEDDLSSAIEELIGLLDGLGLDIDTVAADLRSVKVPNFDDFEFDEDSAVWVEDQQSQWYIKHVNIFKSEVAKILGNLAI